MLALDRGEREGFESRQKIQVDAERACREHRGLKDVRPQRPAVPAQLVEEAALDAYSRA